MDEIPTSQATLAKPRRPLLAVLFLCWALFCWAALGHYVAVREDELSLWIVALLVLAPLGTALAAAGLRRRWEVLTRPLAEVLRRHTAAIDALPDARLAVWIALAACLGLYAELALIRLHASQFQLFGYFKNVSLLSCFLGLGIGYARGGRGLLMTPLVLPLLTLQLVFTSLLKSWRDAPFLQNPIPEQLYLGLRAASTINSIVAVFAFLGLVFAFNALCFVPLGQLAARLMTRIGKLRAYGANLLGSIAGILLFNLLSWLWAPPPVWILLLTLTLLPFLVRSRCALSAAAASATLLLVTLSWNPRIDTYDVYSPYQKLTVQVVRGRPPEIQVNNVYYQRMLDLSRESVELHPRLRFPSQYYSLPYRFQPSPERVLIVGSGTGNDVAAALRAGAREIEAVEIDPAILDFGMRLHPEEPYNSKRVRAVNDDARSYIRRARQRYDLIVYGLLDSHTLLSGVSSVRLDSFVYTVEAFREARSKLAEGGVISMTFSTTHRQHARKIFLMLRQTFDGHAPIAFFSDYDEGICFIAGETVTARDIPSGIPLRDLTPDLDRDDISAEVSTDDWPFFYMPERRYPVSYLAMILLLVSISGVWIVQLAPIGSGGFSMPCFFLGAGFMLIETKAITELALVYGSTWVVIGVVITAILIMAYLANRVVIADLAPPRGVTYALLIASIAGGLVLIRADLVEWPITAVQVLLTAALTVPLFFSGLAFSAEIKKTATVAGALSSNMLGAMLGGFLEYNSMYFGFGVLYFLAIAMYGAALIGSLRRSSTVGGAG